MKKRLTAAIVLASLILTTNVLAEEITNLPETTEQPVATAETISETEAEAEPAHTLEVTSKYQ